MTKTTKKDAVIIVIMLVIIGTMIYFVIKAQEGMVSSEGWGIHYCNSTYSYSTYVNQTSCYPPSDSRCCINLQCRLPNGTVEQHEVGCFH